MVVKSFDQIDDNKIVNDTHHKISQKIGGQVIQHRVEDIRDNIVLIDQILIWPDLSRESRQQLLVFRGELQQELHSLLDDIALDRAA